MICWYGYGFFNVIVPPRKQKKVDEEKGADGRMDDCCLNNVGMDFTFDCRETRGWSMAFRYDKSIDNEDEKY